MIVEEASLTPITAETTESLSEAVYESLLEAIIGGVLSPGMMLSAAKLAKLLEVSRTPIHDALWMLARHGLVEIQPNRQARVAQFDRDDLWEIFEMRKLLEGRAAELAAGRMDERQFRPLHAAMDDLRSTTDSTVWIRKWADFDDLFHQTIAESSGNRRLAEDSARYRLLHRGFNRISTEFASLQQAFSEHEEILEAIKAREGAKSRQLMEKHIGFWQIYFTEKFHEQV